MGHSEGREGEQMIRETGAADPDLPCTAHGATGAQSHRRRTNILAVPAHVRGDQGERQRAADPGARSHGATSNMISEQVGITTATADPAAIGHRHHLRWTAMAHGEFQCRTHSTLVGLHGSDWRI